VNAYHQPGVEAGKKAATRLLDLQERVRATLPKSPGQTAGELARALKADPEDLYHLLRHLAANDDSIGRTVAEEPSREQFFSR
jgi:glucose-6-phosphate isomerase